MPSPSLKIVPTPTALFIKQIGIEIDTGFGITPLVGGGLSAASGSLMGLEFDAYLAHAVHKVVGTRDGSKLCNFREHG